MVWKTWVLRTRINAMSVPEGLSWRQASKGNTAYRPLEKTGCPHEHPRYRNAHWNREGLGSFPLRGNEYQLRSLDSNPPCSSGLSSEQHMAHLGSSLSQPSVSSIVACRGWNNFQLFANPVWGGPRYRVLLDCIKCRAIFSFWITLLALSPVLKPYYNPLKVSFVFHFSYFNINQNLK